MKKISVLAVMLTAASAFAAVTGIEPEKPNKITLSSIDVNRIVCPGDSQVTNMAYSKEKGLLLEAKAENVFLKFPVIETDSNGKKDRIYYSGKAELYLSCGNSVYTLLLEAARIPGQTVYLSDTASEMRKANEYTAARTKDELMLELIQALIENKIPKGFRMNDISLEEEYKGIHISSTRELSGGGYTVKELILRSDKQVSITDTELLKLKMCKNPKAVAVVSPVFVGVTSAYIVEGVSK